MCCTSQYGLAVGGATGGCRASPRISRGGVRYVRQLNQNSSATPGHAQSQKDCVEVSGTPGSGSIPIGFNHGLVYPAVPNAR